MSAAHKSETPSVRGKGFNATNQNTNAAEFTPDLATVIAKMGMAGHSVYRTEQGFVVTRWGMSRLCPDLASLVGFARQLGVAK